MAECSLASWPPLHTSQWTPGLGRARQVDGHPEGWLVKVCSWIFFSNDVGLFDIWSSAISHRILRSALYTTTSSVSSVPCFRVYEESKSCSSNSCVCYIEIIKNCHFVIILTLRSWSWSPHWRSREPQAGKLHQDFRRRRELLIWWNMWVSQSH